MNNSIEKKLRSLISRKADDIIIDIINVFQYDKTRSSYIDVFI